MIEAASTSRHASQSLNATRSAVAADAVSFEHICRAIAKLGAVLKRPEGSGFGLVSVFAMWTFLDVWLRKLRTHGMR
jgi:hypothetical protein